MDKQQFIDALFARAREAGFEACEVYYSASDSFSTNVLKGEILGYSVSGELGLGFRGLYGGKMGYASTQILDEDAVDQLVESAKTNAELIENEDKQFLWDGSGEYAPASGCNPELEQLSAARKIEMARELENRVLAQDERIEHVEGCGVDTDVSEVTIVNTLGLNVSRRGGLMMAYVGAVARDGEKVNSGFAFEGVTDPAKVDLEKLAQRAARDVIDGLNAVSMESGAMPVMFTPDAAIAMLQTFSSVFSAEAAQKGMSLLKGREGDVIAADCVTLVDDPRYPGNYASRAFDGEGVPTSVKNVIEGGRLTTLLHNLKTAHKQGVTTTGNAARGYSSPISVAPSNFYFRPTQTTEDEMLAKLGDGLVVTDVEGLHSGANAITGDFSLSAKGWRVEGGKRVHAVKQITVAGNFYQMLKDVVAVGGDLKFGFPSGSMFGSPSLLISRLSVAGK